MRDGTYGIACLAQAEDLLFEFYQWYHAGLFGLAGRRTVGDECAKRVFLHK
jgi:hypothetical protein